MVDDFEQENLQYITNEIILAAKEDVIEDRKNRLHEKEGYLSEDLVVDGISVKYKAALGKHDKAYVGEGGAIIHVPDLKYENKIVPSATNLDIRLNAIADQLYPYPEDISDNQARIISENKQAFINKTRKALIEDGIYSKLKKDLNDHAIKGVNKTTMETITTIVKILWLYLRSGLQQNYLVENQIQKK